MRYLLLSTTTDHSKNMYHNHDKYLGIQWRICLNWILFTPKLPKFMINTPALENPKLTKHCEVILSCSHYILTNSEAWPSQMLGSDKVSSIIYLIHKFRLTPKYIHRISKAPRPPVPHETYQSINTQTICISSLLEQSLFTPVTLDHAESAIRYCKHHSRVVVPIASLTYTPEKTKDWKYKSALYL